MNDNISRYLKIMEEDSKVGFIRLIHSGLGNSQELYKDEFLLINNDSQYYLDNHNRQEKQQ